MPYECVYKCVSCHLPLSNHQVMYSRGTCPYCGNTQRGTVVKHYKEAGRFVNRPYNIPLGRFLNLLGFGVWEWEPKKT